MSGMMVSPIPTPSKKRSKAEYRLSGAAPLTTRVGSARLATRVRLTSTTRLPTPALEDPERVHDGMKGLDPQRLMDAHVGVRRAPRGHPSRQDQNAGRGAGRQVRSLRHGRGDSPRAGGTSTIHRPPFRRHGRRHGGVEPGGPDHPPHGDAGGAFAPGRVEQHGQFPALEPEMAADRIAGVSKPILPVRASHSGQSAPQSGASLRISVTVMGALASASVKADAGRSSGPGETSPARHRIRNQTGRDMRAT